MPQSDTHLIAFYLPQFHPIPENDAWWGKGFTEWRSVARARALFPGHYQPHAPADLGYYDLRVPETRAEQAALAREHGIGGFCYYHYWFNGRRLLERPLDDVHRSGAPDFPFCVCWANENWSRRWDGGDQSLLVEQRYGFDDSRRLFEAFLRLFADRRYLRVDGRPLLVVYKPQLIPDVVATTRMWREQARTAGERDPFLVCCETASRTTPGALGCDASAEFPPHQFHTYWMNATVRGLAPGFNGLVTSYRALIAQSIERDVSDATRLRCVAPGWDNTARLGLRSTVFAGSSPELFGYWAEAMARDTRARRRGDEQLLFVNAWNEWAEGTHLEPDDRYGRAWLEATRDGLAEGTAAIGDARSG